MNVVGNLGFLLMCNFFLVCFSCDNFSVDNCKISCICDYILKVCWWFIFVFVVELKLVVFILMRLFDEILIFFGGGKVLFVKKWEIEDNFWKLGVFFVKLNFVDLLDNVFKKFV